jgi:hypothetical protein
VKTPKLALCRLTGSGLQTFPENVKNPDAVFLSCNDYVVRWVEMPKLPAAEIRNYIAYRLPRWFPEETGTIAFEPLVKYKNQNGLIPVLAAPAALINALYAAYPRAKIGAVCTAFLDPPESCARIVVFGDYFECVVAKDAEWSVVEAGSLATTDMPELLRRCSKQAQKTQIICDRGAYQDLAALENEHCSALLHEAALSPALLKGPPAFKEVLPGGFSGRRLAAIAAAAFLVLLNCAIFINARHYNLLAAYYKNSLANALRIATLRERYAARLREAVVEAPEETYPAIDPYQFLAALKTHTQSPLVIQTLSLTPGSFALEAETQNSIELLAELSASPLFSNLRLAGVQLLPNGNGERFTLTGAFHDRP